MKFLLFKKKEITFMAEGLNMIAQCNALGRGIRNIIFALKGQHIVENKYIALSGRIFPAHYSTQRDALGYRIIGFQPNLLLFKILCKPSFRAQRGISYIIVILFFTLASCVKPPIVDPHEEEPVTPPEFTSILGFYLLNEGNMGNNKSTLDYFDCETGIYHRNIYADVNPSVPKELGDVGNDIAIYGSKLYAVISCSNKIEVMDAKTAKRIGQINVPNCRNITFYNGFVYVTSYAGPVQHNPTLQQAGYVAKIDTATLQVLEQCVVGQQPDGLAIANKKIYVANSGGYLSPNYENTVSIIDLATFKELQRLAVAVNLHRVCADKHGNIWVTSRGDYFNTPAKLFCIDSKSDKITDSIQIAASNFHLDGDKLYLVGSGWNSSAMQDESQYGIVDVVSKQIVSTQFITDGTEAKIGNPYGITVNPITKDIYVTDAHNYVSPGTLYCFDKEGKKKWEVRTGDIPGHFAFYGKY